jgi:DNA-binding NarL/FixJ family response regulator
MPRPAHSTKFRPRPVLINDATAKVVPLPAKPKLNARSGRFILTRERWQNIAQSLRLSDRELQIIQGIFDDQKEFAIAQDLTISVHTVHTHLERVYRKLGVSSRVSLVLYILSQHIWPPA